MKRWPLAAILLVAAAGAHAQDMTGYHLTFDQNFGTGGVSAAPPGSGSTWETSIPYGDLSTGNNGVVNPTAAGQPGSQYSMSGCALNMAVSSQYSPYLDTGASFTQQYGFFEASIKQGAGGVWNAFWLLPQSGPWPPEIDILEGNGTDAEFTNHGGDINTPVSNYNVYDQPGLSSGFHTYGLMWTPSTLTWFLDGQAVYSAPTASNEQQAMKLILSAYNQGGGPTSMQVAWVRAYSNNPSVPAVQPAPFGNCPETGVAQSNTSPIASAAPGAGTIELPPQAAPAVADTQATTTTPLSCGSPSYFTVSMDGQQLGGVRSAAGLSAANIPTSYTSGGHSVIVRMSKSDGSPWVNTCQPGMQQAAVQVVPPAAAPATVQALPTEAPQAAVQSLMEESPAAPVAPSLAAARQPEQTPYRHHYHRRSRHEAEARPLDQRHGLERWAR